MVAETIRVLILEDNPSDAELVVHELRRAGFAPEWQRVESEKDFQQALLQNPDIILADYSLPQFDALRALHRLQETGLDVPFIIITGMSNEEVAVDCMNQGASDYLLKDRLTRLGPAVLHALEQAKLHRREKQTEQALQKSEALNQAILSSLNAHIAVLDREGNIIAVNDAWERFARANGDPDLSCTGKGQNYLAITRQAAGQGIEDAQKALDGILSVTSGSELVFSMEYPAHSQTSKRWFLLYVTPLDAAQGGVVITHLEITQRKLAEERLTLLSTALEAADNAVIITDQAGTIVWVNPAFTRQSGYTYNQAVGHLSHLANPRAHDPSLFTNMWKTILDGQVWHSEVLNRRKDGSTYTADITITPVRNDQGQISHFIDIEQDVTNRKQHERELEAIVVVANSLRTATTRYEMLPVILDQLLDLVKGDGGAICLYDPVNDEMVVTLGRGPFEKISGMRYLASEGLTGHVVSSRQPYLTSNVLEDPRHIEKITDLPCALAGAPLLAQGQTVGILWVGRKAEFTQTEAQLINAIADMAANAIYRSSLYEETELRYQRLAALREVDKAITASHDVRATLSILVDQVAAQLSIHAVDVLLFNPETQSLEYAASHGFRHNYLPSARTIGHGLAQQAVLNRRTIAITDVNADPSVPGNRLMMRGEEFAAYFAVPLVAKGQVKGVLELFHRTPLSPNPEWLNFLETLAGQAAIAVDSAQMFVDLQRSNLNLAVAYDRTIEAWAQALELRDHETERHSQRVTDMTVLLARAAGVRESDLIHVRRGALLHDVGKMGIPDLIFLKNGPLNEDEWKIMRKHPDHAYEWLSPIEFLHPALEIPYCHHERWDGRGYPRGLKGEQIPLAARIFSVVDVFDALTNDRPYRKKWSVEDTLEYLREQAGKHFDPNVVDLFFKINFPAGLESQ